MANFKKPVLGCIDSDFCKKIIITLSRLAARRSDTTRPPDEAAGCCHCLYDVDSVGAVEWSKPGAATAYMTVEKVKNGEEEKKKKNKCFGGGQVQS